MRVAVSDTPLTPPADVQAQVDDLARLFPYTKALCAETTAECQPTPPTSTTPSQPSASHGFLQPVTPVASFMSGNLECGNAACHKALVPPLLRCSKCKRKAYCCKACKVGPRRPRHAQLAARAPASARSLTYVHAMSPCLHSAARRPPRGRPGTSTSAARWDRAQRWRSSGAPRGLPRAMTRGLPRSRHACARA